jgi:hypothetical protein
MPFIHDHYLPPTPSQSIFEEEDRDMQFVPCTLVRSRDEIELAEDDDDDARSHMRTPLLPPVLAIGTHIPEEPIQSPLQSPAIVDSPAMGNSIFESPRFCGLPSPPLSTKPSVASFHHRPLMPASEIPPILLADPQDEWAKKLGHANFVIEPEPYMPDEFDVASCKQLRNDWDVARTNYAGHLQRTCEHYSITSKIYQLTEQKWATIDAQWKHNHEEALSRIPHLTVVLPPRNSQEDGALAPPKAVPALVRSASDPVNNEAAKFPRAGDAGIVGPMDRVKPLLQPKQSRKRQFWKFLQGVLPSTVAFGRSSQ